MDILAGCAGYINAVDIAEKYISSGEKNNALVIGVDILSKYTNMEDVSTRIIFSDGAGAVFFERAENEKIYSSYILSDGINGEILTCDTDSTIFMDGKKVYKYAISEATNNILELLRKNNEQLENIKFIVPHQANLRILDSIAKKLNIDNNKIYKNIAYTGNTFCASIPIALDDMFINK